jgi:NitT/TauT family transport system permease protein
VMYVGIGFASKFLLAFSLVVVIIMVNTFEGIRSVDQNLVNAMRILGASRVQMFRQVLIPNCVPWILAGLRVSVSFAIVGAIVGEFISSQAGIGYMIDKASGAYDTTGMMVPLLVLMMCAVLIDFLIVQLSNHFLRWRPTKVEED